MINRITLCIINAVLGSTFKIQGYIQLFIVLILTCLSQISFADPIVTYLTDLEGSRIRFEQFLRQNKQFEIGADGKFHLKRNACFVYGGDASDRYLGSLWVVEELVRLKQESPDQVTLIIGNRDINKMRLTTELSFSALKKPPVKFHFTNEEAWKKSIGSVTRPERLKFMLSYTMGASKAFELRRSELAINSNVSQEAVSDEKVVESFLNELQAAGSYRRFLELGELVHRIGNTLFLHGGVTIENFGYIPGQLNRITKIDDWIVAINKWLQTGVKIWASRTQEWSGDTLRAEQAWLDYPMPNPVTNSKPESVITGRNRDRLNNPRLPPKSIMEELLKQGIERIVVGHTPTGDYPVILRGLDDRFEVVYGDNSYAKSEEFASLVYFSGPQLKETSIQGTVALESGAVDVISNLSLGVRTSIGKKFNDGLLLGHLKKDPRVLVSFHYGENFRVVTDEVLESKIEMAKLLEPSLECETSLIK